ncbi:MAG: accessory factor UbiK family protein [Pseudomonadales bacterium]|jgi:BMFP domain-containing protein YqiC|nr:accessory factor UbiK family protein [Pseudomonadales bacterium]
MTDDDPIRRLADQISRLLPRGGPPLPAAFQEDLRALLQGMIARSELVTREEFDAQVAVLRRTREKLEALEQELARLDDALPGTAL